MERNEVSPKSQSKITAAIEEGPYYKSGSPRQTRISTEGVPGQKLILTGRVIDLQGRPVVGAWLDFWQADGNGVYDNAGYVLRGHQYTDDLGDYKLETVVPGGYAGRTPHLHVKVRAREGAPVLTTQLFIPGMSSNRSDFLFREDLQLKVKDTSAGRSANFDFIVEG